MTIEFVGPPGAGKSHLYAHLLALLAEQGPVPSRSAEPADDQPLAAVQFRKVVDVGRFLVGHPTRAATVARVVSRSRQQHPREAATKTANLLAELRRGRSGPSARLTEQGVLQAIWSVALRARTPTTQQLLQHSREWLPHTALLVTVERGEIARRLHDRDTGRSRLDVADATSMDTELARGERVMIELLDRWQGLDADHTVIELRNDRGSDPGAVLGPELERIRSRLNPLES